MKKDRRDIFLEELSKTPIVSVVCQKVGLSRQTIYRWLSEDSKFKVQFNTAISRGRDSVNDLAESKLINKIRDDNMIAIQFWLRNNKINYRHPKTAHYTDVAYSELDKYRNEIIQLIEFKKLESSPKSDTNQSWRQKLAHYSDEDLIKLLRDAKKLKEMKESKDDPTQPS